MSKRSLDVVAQPLQPLIGVPVDSNGVEEVRYFVDEDQADIALGMISSQRPIKLAGAWSHLDADAMLDDLERIRHVSTPTPPIDHL